MTIFTAIGDNDLLIIGFNDQKEFTSLNTSLSMAWQYLQGARPSGAGAFDHQNQSIQF